MKHKTVAQAYLDTLVPYGGEMRRRGDVILDLERMGITGKGKDLFLFGQDRMATRLEGYRLSSPS